MSVPIPMGYGPDDNGGVIELLEGQIKHGRALSYAISDVAYVLMANGGSPNLAVASALRDSLVDWFCAGIEEQVRRMKLAPKIVAVPWGPTPETLIRLVKERDKIQQALDQYAGIGEKLDGLPGGEVLVTWMQTMEMPLQNQLESINEEITRVQEQLEKATTQPSKPNAPHAGGNE